MNFFKKGDIIKVGDKFTNDHPRLKGQFGRVISTNGDLCSVLFKKSDPFLYDFHYTKLSNPKIIRKRKIELILND